MFSDINSTAKLVHERNVNWWIDLKTGLRVDRNRKEMILLIISEITEAFEGWRKKNRKDDKLPQHPQIVVELADYAIRLLDFAAGHGIEINQNGYNDQFKDLAAFEPVMGAELFNLVEETMYLSKPHHEGKWHGHQIGVLIAWAQRIANDFGSFEEAFTDKMEYNRTRADHSIEHRLNDPEGKQV